MSPRRGEDEELTRPRGPEVGERTVADSARTRTYREVFANGPTAMAICDPSGHVVELNAALRRLLGYDDDTDLDALTLHGLFSTQDAEELLQARTALAENGRARHLREQRQLWCADGERVWTFLAVSMLRDSECLEDAGDTTGAGATREAGAITEAGAVGEAGATGDTAHCFLITVEDGSELHHLQERLHYQGLHDVLTGLPNRQFFRTRLERALGRLPAQDTITLYHLALDGFGLINNGLGYEIGDSVIKAVARTLERLVEDEEALVARFGGTEFAILVHESSSTPTIGAFAATINEELSEPIYFGDDGIATPASIGIARRAIGEASAEDLIWSAEVALREAEVAGKRQWALFDPDRAPDERIDAKLAAVVPGALELGGFDVTFRPVLMLGSRRVLALWTQLSWSTEERGRLEHDQCLQLAERSGVTLSLRDWLVHTAWDHAHAWRNAGYWPKVVVDLSTNQTQDPDLVATVREIVDAGKLDPEHLCLALPVEALTGEQEETRENVGVLHELGVSVALREFHGSPVELRCLRDLPVCVVRLAPALVEIVQSSVDDDAPEVRAVFQVVSLIHACGVRIAVHGIETEQQAERWQEMGCSISAGSLHGDPLEPFTVPSFLKQVGTVDVGHSPS